MTAVKVKTLECFSSMVKVLDKVSLTQKLVPMLAQIKTKEPEGESCSSTLDLATSLT